MPVLSGAEPFSHDGSDDIGVLLCHGFTSTPQSMRAWGERLAAEGCTVRSAVDHVVEPVNAATVLDGVRSEDLTEVVLADSFHVATSDHDAPRVFSGSVEFLQRIHRDRVEELV